MVSNYRKFEVLYQLGVKRRDYNMGYTLVQDMIRKILSNFLLLLISSIVSLFLLEWLIRVALPVHDPSGMLTFYFDEEIGVLLAPKNSVSRLWRNSGDFDVTVRINQYGFRDRKDLRLSTQDDIFVVGDSFSFGLGVEEDKRYSNLLEEMLDRPIYNISIPTDFDGYDRLIKYANKNGATIHQLIIGVTMENDLGNYVIDISSNSEINSAPTVSNLTILNTPPESQATPVAISTSQTTQVQTTIETQPDNGETAYQIDQLYQKFIALKFYLFNHSATYNAFISAIYNIDFLRETVTNLGLTDRADLTVTKSIYSDNILNQSVQRLVHLQQDNDIPQIIVVIIPSRALWVGNNQAVEAQVHNEFVALLQKRGFTVVDLRPSFEQGGNPMQYHFPVDGHWNEKGHQKAAQEIYRLLAGS